NNRNLLSFPTRRFSDLPAEILERVGMEHALAKLSSKSLAEKMALVWQTPPEIDQHRLMHYELQHICQQYLSLKD
ncbi:MAG TPA: hypothetical protein DDY50_01975, partial [Erwinia persicina]|nr:hypothetical protein [Erwinia persicina]